jgi:hypothetical protein
MRQYLYLINANLLGLFHKMAALVHICVDIRIQLFKVEDAYIGWHERLPSRKQKNTRI